MDTRRLNDTEPLSLVGYTFGAGDGIPAPAVIYHSVGSVRWPIPERPQVIGWQVLICVSGGRTGRKGCRRIDGVLKTSVREYSRLV
jgi:hypothetical protein